MKALKQGPPRFIAEARQATNGLPIKPTDPLLQAMRGSIWAIEFDDGTTIWPQRAVYLMSYSLDIITSVIGSLLVRGEDTWQAITPGSPGQVLTSNGSDALPTYQDSTGGGASTATTGATVTRTSNQSVAPTINVPVQYDATETDDGEPAYYNATYPSRLTVPANGWYILQGYVNWQSSTFGYREIKLRINGSTVLVVQHAPTISGENTNSPATITAAAYLTTADYAELIAYSSYIAGTTLTNARFSIVRAG